MAEQTAWWLKLVAAGLVSAVVAIGGSVLLSWRDLGVFSARLDILERHATDGERKLAELITAHNAVVTAETRNTTHRLEHEKTSERWINQIIRNSELIREMRSTPEARPDPFTGTEGRELQRQIDELSSKLRKSQ